MQNYILDKYNSEGKIPIVDNEVDIYKTIKESKQSVNEFYDRVLERLWEEKRKPVLMRPPF